MTVNDDLYEFVQLEPFTQVLDRLGDDELLQQIETELSTNPLAGKELKGGIRKLRVGDRTKAKGKRGGYRVWHFFYRKGSVIYLLYLLDKREAENISKGQEARLVERLRQALRR